MISINTIITLIATAAAFLSAFIFRITIYEWWIPPIAFAVGWVAAFLLSWGIIALVSLTVNTKKLYMEPGKFYPWFFNICYKYVCQLANIKVKVTGLDKIPSDTVTFLLVSNHRSKFDNMIQSYILHRYKLAYISKPENFKIPMGHRLMTRCCYLPIDRENPRKALETINAAAALVMSGEVSMGVYPEGHRGPGPLCAEFSSGCFMIATKAKCPIVVVVMSGTEKIHKHAPWIQTKVNMDIIDVIGNDTVRDKSSAEISDYVRTEINKYISKNKGR